MPTAFPVAVLVESAVAFTVWLTVNLPPTCAFVEPPASMVGFATPTVISPNLREKASTVAVLVEVAVRSIGPAPTMMLPAGMLASGALFSPEPMYVSTTCVVLAVGRTTPTTILPPSRKTVVVVAVLVASAETSNVPAALTLAPSLTKARVPPPASACGMATRTSNSPSSTPAALEVAVLWEVASSMRSPLVMFRFASVLT